MQIWPIATPSSLDLAPRRSASSSVLSSAAPLRTTMTAAAPLRTTTWTQWEDGAWLQGAMYTCMDVRSGASATDLSQNGSRPFAIDHPSRHWLVNMMQRFSASMYISCKLIANLFCSSRNHICAVPCDVGCKSCACRLYQTALRGRIWPFASSPIHPPSVRPSACHLQSPI